MKTTLARLILALGLAAPAAAQAPPPPPPPGPHPADVGKWWKNSEIARTLALSADQVQRIEQAFLDHRLKLIDLRAELERQEARLQPLIEADQPDEAKVGAQIDLVLAARGRLEKANAMMMLAIRRILTVDQWRKLEAIKEERERRHAAPPPHPGQPPQPGPRPGRSGEAPPPPPPGEPRPDGEARE